MADEMNITAGSGATTSNLVMLRPTVPVSVNGIEFDALIEDERSLSAEVPEYTVEDGYSVSDSIIFASEEISMTLIVAELPVTWASRHNESNRLQNVLKQLEELFYSRAVCTVTMPEVIYTDMAITSMTFSKNIEAGNSREIPITFKKIRKTEIAKTTYPGSYGKAGKSGASGGTANIAKAKTSNSGNPLDVKNSQNGGYTILGLKMYGTKPEDYVYKGEVSKKGMTVIKGVVKD